MSLTLFFGYTKTMVRAKPSRLDEKQIQALRAGSECFNQGLYFQAHEAWERQWRKLPAPDQPQVQAAILTCGFFILIGKQRFEPALRLAQLAMDRFAEASAQAKLLRLQPVLRLPKVESRLIRMVARIRLGERDGALLLSDVKGLKASVKETL